MDRASSFAQHTIERNFRDNLESTESDVETGTDTNTIGDSTARNSPKEAGLKAGKSPNPPVIVPLIWTSLSSSLTVSLYLLYLLLPRGCYSLVQVVQTLDQPWQTTTSQEPKMMQFSTIKILEIQEEKLKMELANFTRDEQKDDFDKKRLKTHENKSLIEAFFEISKLNFETMKMRQKMKEEAKMSDEEIANIFSLLEYPPKPSWS
jgi:hypothetical protein